MRSGRGRAQTHEVGNCSVGQLAHPKPLNLIHRARQNPLVATLTSISNTQMATESAAEAAAAGWGWVEAIELNHWRLPNAHGSKEA